MWLRSLWQKIIALFRRRQLALALYGPPNGGKTTLANRICADWLGEEMGSVSKIAHETRKIQMKNGIKVVASDGRTLTFTLADTPGIAARIDYEDFLSEGLGEQEAKDRAREAAQGVLESVQWIENAQCIVIVLDATKEPHSQVNASLIEAITLRRIPALIVANKIDLKRANVERVGTAFPEQEVLGISAKYGDNVERFYDKLFDMTAKVS
jgi:tRNA U34 5-carboxymethylaminomethyl modifying GTPase MnmE/TrmE